METGWRDAPLALRDLAVSNLHGKENHEEQTWVNIQHVEKTDKKQKKKYKLQSGKQCPVTLWRQKAIGIF